MKALILTFGLPVSALSLGAAITASVVYAAALVLGLALVLLFVLALRREIVVHVELSGKEKKIWFERISSKKR